MLVNILNKQEAAKTLACLAPGEVFTVSDTTRYPDVYMAYIPSSGVGKLAISLTSFKRMDIPAVYTCTPVKAAVLNVTI